MGDREETYTFWGKEPLWINIRSALESPPSKQAGWLVERIRENFEKPPSPIWAVRNVPPEAKNLFQWESLALHFMHGCIEQQSSLVTLGNQFGQVVAGFANNLITDADEETFVQALADTPEGRILGSAGLRELLAGYARTVARTLVANTHKDFIKKPESTDERLLELADTVIICDHGGTISLQESIVLGTDSLEYKVLLERAAEVMGEFNRVESMSPLLRALFMREVHQSLTEHVERSFSRAEDEAWRILPRMVDVPKRNRSKRKPDPVTDLEHLCLRACFLVKALGATHKSASQNVKSLGHLRPSKVRLSFEVTDSQRGVNMLGKLLEQARMSPPTSLFLFRNLKDLILKTLVDS